MKNIRFLTLDAVLISLLSGTLMSNAIDVVAAEQKNIVEQEFLRAFEYVLDECDGPRPDLFEFALELHLLTVRLISPLTIKEQNTLINRPDKNSRTFIQLAELKSGSNCKRVLAKLLKIQKDHELMARAKLDDLTLTEIAARAQIRASEKKD